MSTAASDDAQRAAARPWFGLRHAILLGFAATIGIWILAYFYFTRQIDVFQDRQAALSETYRRAQTDLVVLRSQLISGATAARSALYGTSPLEIAEQRVEIERARAAADDVLRHYSTGMRNEHALDSEAQRLQFTALTQEVKAFDGAMADLLADHTSPTAPPAAALVARRVTSVHQAGMNAAETLLRLNRESFTDEQDRTFREQRAAQKGIIGVVGLALVASLGIAFALSRHAGQLETRVRLQQARDQDNAINLRRLTARLVSAQEEERRHIARELHDEIGQVLTVVKFALREAQESLATPKQSALAIEAARQVADKALQAVRDLSRMLRPSLLDDMGVTLALEAHVQAFRERYGVAVTAKFVNMEGRFGPDVELALFRTVQEALTNVARHARATMCSVTLRRVGSCVSVSIEDNGQGFDTATTLQPGPNRGLGLLGMQERVQQLWGEAKIESVRGRGTRVFANIPLPAAMDTMDAAAAFPVPESQGTHS